MTSTIETTEVAPAPVPALAITTDRTELASAVTWAAKGLPKRPIVPTLAGMRLEVSAGTLEVSAGTLELAGFDYDMTCTARVAGTGASDGTALVNGAQLLAAVKALPVPKPKRAQLVTLHGNHA